MEKHSPADGESGQLYRLTNREEFPAAQLKFG